jgi:hypothetical protein
MTRFPLLFLTAVLVALVFCAGAQAYVTVGQIAPPDPESYCNLGPTDTIQLAIEGSSDIYAVPDAGLLTSWSTSAGPGVGQALSLKVYRPVSGTTYSVVAQDGPRALTASVVNTFPIDIPVEAGDVIGLNDGNAPAFHDACSFFTGLPGDMESGLDGEAPAGSLLDFAPVDTEPNVRVNVSATLETLLVAEPVTPVTSPSPPTASPSGPPAATPPPGSVAPPAQCLVPRLGAKKLAVAKKLLLSAHCRLGRVTKLNGATVKSGLVVSQNPQTGKKLGAGAKVAVKLAPPNA